MRGIDTGGSSSTPPETLKEAVQASAEWAEGFSREFSKQQRDTLP
jgi:hypothetical protein